MQKHGRCTSAKLFEVSRELHHHGEKDGVPYSRTLYCHTRKLLDKHWEELSETPHFTFLQDANLHIGRPRIVTTYEHEVHAYSNGSKRNQLQNLRSKLQEAYPEQKRPRGNSRKKRNMWLGSTAFNTLVVTQVNDDPGVSLFTLQPSTHTIESGAVDELLDERQLQAEILGTPNLGVRSVADTELNIGIPVARCSLGDVYRSYGGSDDATRQEQNKLLTLASITVASLVNQDLVKTLHPAQSAHLVSYAADQPRFVEAAPFTEEDFGSIPQPRIETLPTMLAAPGVVRQRVQLS